MLKKDLLSEVAKHGGHPEPLVRAILEDTKQVVLEALSEGRSVMLLGLGKMSVVARGPRKGRNLYTGEAVAVGARNAVVLRTSEAVRDAVNPGLALDKFVKSLPAA